MPNTITTPDATDVTKFATLDIGEKRNVIVATFAALEELWGQHCMPAIDAGDNRTYDLAEIAAALDWALIQQHNEAHNRRRG